MYDIVLIPGDGIGPEVIQATIKVIEAAGVKIRWHTCLAGQAAVRKTGSPLPDETINLMKKIGVALKGPLIVEKGRGSLVISRQGRIHRYPSVNNAIRRETGAFVNVRPIRSLPGVRSRYHGVDVVIMREVTEGIYSGHEHSVGDDAAEAIKIITRQASEKVARYAFEYATARERKKVTVVHKANVLGLTDGLFLESARRVARDYASIAVEDLMVDNACYQLVVDPTRFDVLLLPNQYGDIVSDLCAGLVGSLGLAPGANIGEEVAYFEAVHGAAPDIASKGIANPVAMILSGAMMLDHIGEQGVSDRIRKAVASVLEERHSLTPDIGGKGTTLEMIQDIVATLV
jgi:isocitrate dehydrogenase (NAD+)